MPPINFNALLASKAAGLGLRREDEQRRESFGGAAAPQLGPPPNMAPPKMPERPAMPEEGIAMKTVGGLGNLLDLPGSMVRDVLTLNNPFDQLLSPFSDENRARGADFRQSFLSGEGGSTGAKVGRFATDLGIEILLDPLTYMTFGLSAAAKGAKAGAYATRAASKVGLLDDAAKIATKKAGKGKKIGRREALQKVNTSELLDYSRARDAKKALGRDPKRVQAGQMSKRMQFRSALNTELKKLSKEKAAKIEKEIMEGAPLAEGAINFKLPGNLVNVSFGGEKTARAMDVAGETLRYSKPGLAISRVFSKPMRGRKTKASQVARVEEARDIAEDSSAAAYLLADPLKNIGTVLANLSDAEQTKLGGLMYKYIEDIDREGLQLTKAKGPDGKVRVVNKTYAQSAADYAAREEFAPLAGILKDLDAIKEESKIALKYAQDSGVAVEHVDDLYANYAARSRNAAEVNAPLKRKGGTASYQPKSEFATKRADHLRNIKGGTQTIQEMSLKTEAEGGFAGIFSESKKRGNPKTRNEKDALRAKFNEEFVDTGIVPAEHAAKLFDTIANRPLDQVQAGRGLFQPNPAESAMQAVTSLYESAGEARGLAKFIKQNAALPQNFHQLRLKDELEGSKFARTADDREMGNTVIDIFNDMVTNNSGRFTTDPMARWRIGNAAEEGREWFSVTGAGPKKGPGDAGPSGGTGGSRPQGPSGGGGGGGGVGGDPAGRPSGVAVDKAKDLLGKVDDSENAFSPVGINNNLKKIGTDLGLQYKSDITSTEWIDQIRTRVGELDVQAADAAKAAVSRTERAHKAFMHAITGRGPAENRERLVDLAEELKDLGDPASASYASTLEARFPEVFSPGTATSAATRVNPETGRVIETVAGGSKDVVRERAAAARANGKVEVAEKIEREYGLASQESLSEGRGLTTVAADQVAPMAYNAKRRVYADLARIYPDKYPKKRNPNTAELDEALAGAANDGELIHGQTGMKVKELQAETPAPAKATDDSGDIEIIPNQGPAPPDSEMVVRTLESIDKMKDKLVKDRREQLFKEYGGRYPRKSNESLEDMKQVLRDASEAGDLVMHPHYPNSNAIKSRADAAAKKGKPERKGAGSKAGRKGKPDPLDPNFAFESATDEAIERMSDKVLKSRFQKLLRDFPEKYPKGYAVPAFNRTLFIDAMKQAAKQGDLVMDYRFDGATAVRPKPGASPKTAESTAEATASVAAQVIDSADDNMTPEVIQSVLQKTQKDMESLSATGGSQVAALQQQIQSLMEQLTDLATKSDAAQASRAAASAASESVEAVATAPTFREGKNLVISLRQAFPDKYTTKNSKLTSKATVQSAVDRAVEEGDLVRGQDGTLSLGTEATSSEAVQQAAQAASKKAENKARSDAGRLAVILLNTPGYDASDLQDFSGLMKFLRQGSEEQKAIAKRLKKRKDKGEDPDKLLLSGLQSAEADLIKNGPLESLLMKFFAMESDNLPEASDLVVERLLTNGTDQAKDLAEQFLEVNKAKYSAMPPARQGSAANRYEELANKYQKVVTGNTGQSKRVGDKPFRAEVKAINRYEQGLKDAEKAQGKLRQQAIKDRPPVGPHPELEVYRMVVEVAGEGQEVTKLAASKKADLEDELEQLKYYDPDNYDKEMELREQIGTLNDYIETSVTGKDEVYKMLNIGAKPQFSVGANKGVIIPKMLSDIAAGIGATTVARKGKRSRNRGAEPLRQIAMQMFDAEPPAWLVEAREKLMANAAHTPDEAELAAFIVTNDMLQPHGKRHLAGIPDDVLKSIVQKQQTPNMRDARSLTPEAAERVAELYPAGATPERLTEEMIELGELAGMKFDRKAFDKNRSAYMDSWKSDTMKRVNDFMVKQAEEAKAPAAPAAPQATGAARAVSDTPKMTEAALDLYRQSKAEEYYELYTQKSRYPDAPSNQRIDEIMGMQGISFEDAIDFLIEQELRDGEAGFIELGQAIPRPLGVSASRSGASVDSEIARGINEAVGESYRPISGSAAEDVFDFLTPRVGMTMTQLYERSGPELNRLRTAVAEAGGEERLMAALRQYDEQAAKINAAAASLIKPEEADMIMRATGESSPAFGKLGDPAVTELMRQNAAALDARGNRATAMMVDALGSPLKDQSGMLLGSTNPDDYVFPQVIGRLANQARRVRYEDEYGYRTIEHLLQNEPEVFRQMVFDAQSVIGRDMDLNFGNAAKPHTKLPQELFDENGAVRTMAGNSHEPNAYVSRLDDVADRNPSAPVTADDVQGLGISDMEARMIGLPEFFAGRPAVAVSELRDFVAERSPKITERYMDHESMYRATGDEVPYVEMHVGTGSGASHLAGVVEQAEQGKLLRVMEKQSTSPDSLVAGRMAMLESAARNGMDGIIVQGSEAADEISQVLGGPGVAVEAIGDSGDFALRLDSPTKKAIIDSDGETLFQATSSDTARARITFPVGKDIGRAEDWHKSNIRTNIEAYDSADAKSFAHEVGHLMRYTFRAIGSEEADRIDDLVEKMLLDDPRFVVDDPSALRRKDGTLNYKLVIESVDGVARGNKTQPYNVDEYFADFVIDYMQGKHSQVGQTQAEGVIGMFRDYVASVWTKIKGTPAEENVTDELRAFLDEVVGPNHQYDSNANNIAGILDNAKFSSARLMDKIIQEIGPEEIARGEEFALYRRANAVQAIKGPQEDKFQEILAEYNARKERVINEALAQTGEEPTLFELPELMRKEGEFNGVDLGISPKELLSHFKVDPEVAGDIGRMQKTSEMLLNELAYPVRLYDAIMNTFKTNVTATNPGFHVRNGVSGFLQNAMNDIYDPAPRNTSLNDLPMKMVAVTPGLRRYMAPYGDATTTMLGKDVVGLAEDAPILGFAKGQDEQATDELVRLAVAYGLLESPGQQYDLVGATSQFATDVVPGSDKLSSGDGIVKLIVGRARRNAPAKRSESANIFKVAGGFSGEDKFIGARYGRAVGDVVESGHRLGGFIALLKQGYAPAEAAKRVKLLHVDYANLSDTERQVMRRIFPFYSYSRGMSEYVVKELMTRPGGKVAQTLRAANISRQQDPTMPDYVSKGLSIPLGSGPDGSKSYLTGLNLMHEQPVGLIDSMLSGPQEGLFELVSQTAPPIKAIGELALNRSFFLSGPEGARSLDALDPPVGRTLSNFTNIVGLTDREQAYKIPGGKVSEALIANSPISRYMHTARQAMDTRKPLTARALNTMFGAKINTISPAAQDAVLRERASALMRDLGGKVFNRSYIPEETLEAMSPEQREKAEQYMEIMRVLGQRTKARKAIDEMHQAQENN